MYFNLVVNKTYTEIFRERTRINRYCWNSLNLKHDKMNLIKLQYDTIVIVLFILVLFPCTAVSSEGREKYIYAVHELDQNEALKRLEISQGEGTDNPALAMGLMGIADWSTQMPFVNIFKQARPWIGFEKESTEWGGISFEQLYQVGALDDYGWVKKIPKNVNFVRSVIHWNSETAEQYRKGDYIISYQGTGEITVSNLEGPLTITSVKNGIIEFFYPGSGLIAIDIFSSDTDSNGNYIRNISLYRKEHSWLQEIGAIFNPDWIKKIRDLRTVRFMDWMETNNSTQSSWQNRPKFEDAFWSHKGAPLEIMIALSNHINADPWFNMPHLATDEYISNFATAVKESLNPQLKVYVEYSNEVWNWIFDQAHWAHKQSQLRWGNVEAGWVQYYAIKAANMARLWGEIFGPKGRERLIRVLSMHTGWLGLEEKILYAPAWVQENKNRKDFPYKSFEAYGVTGYFDGGFSGEKSKNGLLKNWLKRSKKRFQRGLTNFPYEDVIQLSIKELRNGGVTGNKAGSIAEIADQTKYHANIAKKHDLKLVMYEGGTHVVGIGDDVEDQELTDYFIHLNNSSQLAELYNDLFRTWHKYGGTLFNAFLDVSSHSKWGSWGALQHLGDNTPRWKVLMNYNQLHNPSWEVRPNGIFDHGIYLKASSSDELIIGSRKDDRINGLGGNDIIYPGGGYDLVHGGEGLDVVVLNGSLADYSVSNENNKVGVKLQQNEIVMVSIEKLHLLGEEKIYNLRDLIN